MHSTLKTFVHCYPRTLQRYGRCLKSIITECIALPTGLNVQFTWLGTHSFLTHTVCFTLFALCLSSPSGTSSTSVYTCAHTHLCTNNTWQSMITITTQDLRTKDSCTKNSCMKRWCFWGVSTYFWIRPATWLHSVHDIAVPISRSPQCNWWGLALAETRPAQRVTLHNIYIGLFYKGDVVRRLFIHTYLW